MVVTVLSAIPWASVVKLVAIANTDTAVDSTHTAHQTVIGLRSRAAASSTSASSSTNTGAHARFANGTRQPARSAQSGRCSSRPTCVKAAARRAINQFVSRTKVANTRKSAATLTTTPTHVASHATTGV